MKKHTDFIDGTQPPPFEPFDFNGITVVALPNRLMPSGLGCGACLGKRVRDYCHKLPPCARVGFVTQEEFDSPEMRVRLVKWRMGLDDGDDE